MYNFFALLSGAIIAVSVVFNGELTQMYGNFNASLIFHIVAVIFSFIFCKIAKQKLFPTVKLPLWFYSGGLFGLFPILFENFSFGKISLTSIMAISLFGQAVTSIVIDTFGLLGMKKHAFRKSSLIGLIFSILGVFVMMGDIRNIDPATALAIFLMFCAGITVVLYRTANAKLSEHVSNMAGSFINHFVGLGFILLLTLIWPGNDISLLGQRPSENLWIYLGGVLGVFTVFLLNIAVPKISSFRVTLLLFVGKVFVGILLDLLLESNFSPESFYGGLIVAAGVILSMLIEHTQDKQLAVKKAQKVEQ